MRKSSLKRRRVRRCRNLQRAHYSGHAQQTDKLRNPNTLKEICEIAFIRGVSARLRRIVLERQDLFCQMCGVSPGDTDELTGRKAKFHIGQIKIKEFGGKDELSNLRALCSTCNQGSKYVTAERPTKIWLLSQVRRAGQDEQRAVLADLLKKFGKPD